MDAAPTSFSSLVYPLAETLGTVLLDRQLLLVTAESCTGGGVAQWLTAVPGSSRWFERGFVTYSNSAKTEMLGVKAATLAVHGAVSEATVREMAHGALHYSHAHLSVAISGIAGPSGGTVEKPVGTVWLAWAGVKATTARCECFSGDREAIRQQAIECALRGLLDHLGGAFRGW